MSVSGSTQTSIVLQANFVYLCLNLFKKLSCFLQASNACRMHVCEVDKLTNNCLINETSNVCRFEKSFKPQQKE